LCSLESPHQGESNGGIFIRFGSLVVKAVFVEVFFTNINQSELRTIAELRIYTVILAKNSAIGGFRKLFADTNFSLKGYQARKYPKKNPNRS